MHIPHGLHTGQRLWYAANSYVSLWVDVLHGWGFEPLAAMASAVTVCFDGDQFTVLSLPCDDLRLLYGVTTFRLAIYDRADHHVAKQTAAGNIVLVDADAYHLPDDTALYGVRHGKTLIAVERVELKLHRASYYRQGKRFELSGADYAGVFTHRRTDDQFNDALIRHVECVKRVYAPVDSGRLPAIAVQLLRRHLADVPRRHPIRAFREAFNDSLDALAAGDEHKCHSFAYGTLSQLGSRFELFSDFLAWLARAPASSGIPVVRDGSALLQAIDASRKLASEALVCQLRLLRASRRGQEDLCEDCLDSIEQEYDALLSHLRYL